MQDTEHRAQAAGHRVQGTGHKAQGTRRRGRAQSTEHRVQGTAHRVQGSGRRVQVLRLARQRQAETGSCFIIPIINQRAQGTQRRVPEAAMSEARGQRRSES